MKKGEKMKNLIFIILILYFITGCTKDSGITNSNNNNHSINTVANPAACYCAILGYKYIIGKDSVGNEEGYCILPDSTKVDEWAFFWGYVGKQYSYCARKGFKIETDTVIFQSFQMVCAFCVQYDSLNNIKNKIEMLKLMEMNGDTLCN
jgi:putative hemolysin